MSVGRISSIGNVTPVENAAALASAERYQVKNSEIAARAVMGMGGGSTAVQSTTLGTVQTGSTPPVGAVGGPTNGGTSMIPPPLNLQVGSQPALVPASPTHNGIIFVLAAAVGIIALYKLGVFT